MIQIGKHTFWPDRQGYIMGILNVTPDSFSDGGQFRELDAALFQAEKMVKEGAAILDVGGESTRPGYTMIPEDEEIERIAPVIEALKARMDVPVSLDTYKGKVALAGIQAGADMINDIWGLKYDNTMAWIIAQHKIACCLMHNRAGADYTDFMQDVVSDIAESIHIAEKAGIPNEKIILDPGVGFGKTSEQNLEIINSLEELNMFGYPILLGTSRKSVIGLALDLPVEERVEGTAATTVIGRMKGAGFFRVHDVKENKRALDMTEAVLKQGRQNVAEIESLGKKHKDFGEVE